MSETLIRARSHFDREARALIHQGYLIVLSNLSFFHELCRYADTLVVKEYDLEAGNEQELCKKYETDPKVGELFTQGLKEAGLDLEDTYWDRLRLRIQPPNGKIDDIANLSYNTGRFSASLPIHRDTWASNISSQINIWAPLQPLEKNRTMQIFPSFFSTPVRNNSGSWSIQALREARKLGKRYPQMPIYTDELKSIEQDALPIMIEPGDVLFFSSAHLHSSVPNTSGMTRFSTETRIVDKSDFLQDLGAPNVDGQAKHLASSWFKKITNPSHKLSCLDKISGYDHEN